MQSGWAKQHSFADQCVRTCVAAVWSPRTAAALQQSQLLQGCCSVGSAHCSYANFIHALVVMVLLECSALQNDSDVATCTAQVLFA